VKAYALAAALVALAIVAPAHANQTIIPDNDPGFVKLVEIWHTAALHQPTFKTRRWCSLSHICEKVEFAVRDDGKVADTFLYPDEAPEDVIWCTVSSDSPNVRYCQSAAGAGSVITWFEAYFPHAASTERSTTVRTPWIPPASHTSARNTTSTNLMSIASCAKGTLRRKSNQTSKGAVFGPLPACAFCVDLAGPIAGGIHIKSTNASGPRPHSSVLLPIRVILSRSSRSPIV
jgi:hypothetical protein